MKNAAIVLGCVLFLTFCAFVAVQMERARARIIVEEMLRQGVGK